MNDLISRQAAIEAFGLSEKTRKYGGDHSGYDTRMLYEIQDILEELPSAQPEQRWIPVTERLPNDERLVLVSCHYGSKLEDFVIPARYAGNPRDYNAIKQQYDIEWDEDDRWLTEGYIHFYGKQVVAWQELPAPYVNEEPPTDGCYGCKHRIIRSVPTSKFYCDLDDAFHDNLTNCPLEQDAPSASEIRGEMFYADMGDDE